MSEVDKPGGLHLQANFGPGLGGLALLALGLHFIVGTPFFAVFLAGFFARCAMRGALWAWIPAALFGLDALSHVGIHWGGIGLPVLFIAAGVLVIAHDHIWAPARKVGLIIIGFLMLGALFNGDHNQRKAIVPPLGISSSTSARSATIPALNGRTLLIEAVSGDVRIKGEDTESPRNAGSGIFVTTGDRVKVQPQTPDGDLEIVVPKDTNVEVHEVSGRVRITDVTGDIKVQSISGDVHTDLDGQTLDVSSVSGAIELSGYDVDHAEKTFHSDGSSPSHVVLMTTSGDVTINRTDTATLR